MVSLPQPTAGEPPRFDDIVRSERYFTTTLLPAILFHHITDTLSGIRGFANLVDAKAKTERKHAGEPLSPKGKQNMVISKTWR